MGILGLGGVSSVAALNSSRVRKFIGISSVISELPPSSTPETDSSSLGEEDRQGQFLYKLSKKLFDSLQQDSGSDLSENPKENVVKGLKDKFNGSLENEEDTWKNFKSLCEAQKQRETQSAPNVDNEYSRLCFLDKESENLKGYLLNGFEFGFETEISPDDNMAFQDLDSNNFELGTSFNNKYPNASPLDKFDEGYFSDTFEAKNLKQVMNEVSSSDYQII